MRQAFKVSLGLALIAAAAWGMAALVIRHFGFVGRDAGQIAGIFAASAFAMAILCLLGERLRIRALAYYLTAGAVTFLGADVLLSLRFDIMLGPRSFQDGLVPAAIVGLFLGALYGIVSGRDAGGRTREPDPPWR
jgi:hypothetical protein